MLDDLVFDGVVTARGDKFKLGSSDKTPEKAAPLAAKPVHDAGHGALGPPRRQRTGGGKKTLKALPKDAGAAPASRAHEARRGNDARTSPDARAHAQEARRGRQDARQEERGMPKFQVAAGRASRRSSVRAGPARARRDARDAARTRPRAAAGAATASGARASSR